MPEPARQVAQAIVLRQPSPQVAKRLRCRGRIPGLLQRELQASHYWLSAVVLAEPIGTVLVGPRAEAEAEVLASATKTITQSLRAIHTPLWWGLEALEMRVAGVRIL